jgi:hypothetical protein
MTTPTKPDIVQSVTDIGKALTGCGCLLLLIFAGLCIFVAVFG